MTVEKTRDGILVYDIVNGQLFKKHYIGYNLKEAKELFKEELKGAHNET